MITDPAILALHDRQKSKDIPDGPTAHYDQSGKVAYYKSNGVKYTPAAASSHFMPPPNQAAAAAPFQYQPFQNQSQQFNFQTPQIYYSFQPGQVQYHYNAEFAAKLAATYPQRQPAAITLPAGMAFGGVLTAGRKQLALEGIVAPLGWPENPFTYNNGKIQEL